MTQQKTDTPRVRLGFGGGTLTGETASNTKSTIRRLFGYAMPYKWSLIAVSLLVVVSTVAALAGPILLGIAIDQYILADDIPGLLRLAIIMLVVYVAGWLASMGHGVIMVGVGQRLIADLRAELFGHLQHLSMAFHDSQRVGDLMSRVTNDTEAINQVLSNGLIEFVTNILMLGGIMVAMVLLSWQLAIATLILLPLMLWITTAVTRRSRVAFREVQHNLGTMNAFMEENIAGIRVVQAFARADDTNAQFAVVNAENRKSGTKADVITAVLGPMFTTMSTITIAATALVWRLALHPRHRHRRRDCDVCRLHHELFPTHARHRHALQPSAIGAGWRRAHL